MFSSSQSIYRCFSVSWSKKFVRTLAGVALLSAIPAVSHAQFGNLGDAITKSLTNAMEKTYKPRIAITPSMIVADIQQKTATIEFTNLSKDTLNAELSAGLKQPSAWGKDADDQANALLADDKSKAGEIPESQSMVNWIKGLPKAIKLAPGEKKTVTVTLQVPADLKHSEYSAWIIATITVKATTWLSDDANSDDNGGSDDEGKIKVGIVGDPGEKPDVKVHSTAKLVYRAKAATP